MFSHQSGVDPSFFSWYVINFQINDLHNNSCKHYIFVSCDMQELENVTMLQMSLKDAARTCVGARFQLKLAREGVSHGGLGLLAKHRKRERLHALLEIFKTLKTLVSV